MFAFLLIALLATLGTEEIAQEHERRQIEQERQETVPMCED
jgi:hypothetical protein